MAIRWQPAGSESLATRLEFQAKVRPRWAKLFYARGRAVIGGQLVLDVLCDGDVPVVIAARALHAGDRREETRCAVRAQVARLVDATHLEWIEDQAQK
jgi:hypothetical protein